MRTTSGPDDESASGAPGQGDDGDGDVGHIGDDAHAAERAAHAAELEDIEASGLPTDRAAFDAQVSKGLKWSLISTISGRVLTPVVSILLARVLVPEDFGVFAVAVSVQAALMSFNDLGVSNAIVWWQGSVERAARTATTLAVASSLILYALCFAAAPFVANFLHVPEATGVLRLLSLTVVIDGAASVPVGLIGREFRQSRRAVADWAGFLVSTGLTIWLAVEGYGAWSLAWGRLAGNLVVTTLMYLLSGQRLRFGWDSEIARKLIGYGLPLAGSSLLVFAMLNTDYIIVGRVLGPTALGLYTIAFNLSSWPSNVLSVTIRRVSIPVFARLRRDPADLVRTFLAGLRNLNLLTVLICAGLFALATPLIHLLYPASYWAAAKPLAMLAVLAVARVVIDFFYDFFAGIGWSRALVAIQGLWVVLLIPGLTIGAQVGGLRGVAIAHVIVAWLVIVPIYAISSLRAGVTIRGLLHACARPLAAGVLAAGAGVAVVGAVGTGLAGFVAAGVTVTVVYLATAAPPRELLTLPKRLPRFEG